LQPLLKREELEKSFGSVVVDLMEIATKKNFKNISDLIWNLDEVLFIFALAFPPDFFG
jgi:hypothetical protein